MSLPFARLSLLVALPLALTTTGCSMQKVARTVAEASAQVAEERVDKPGPSLLGRTLTKVADDPNVQAATRDLVREGTVGVVEGLEKAGIEGRTERLIHVTMQAMGREADATVSHLIEESSPQLRAALREAIRESIQGAAEAMRTGAREDLDEVTRTVTASLVRSLTDALQAQEGLSPAVGRLARDVSREAVIGAGEGMRTLEPLEDPALRSRIYQAGEVFGQGFGRGMPHGMAESPAFLVTMVGMLVVVSVLGSAAIFLLWRQNQATQQALLLLAKKLDAAEPVPTPAPPSRRPPHLSSADLAGI